MWLAVAMVVVTLVLELSMAQSYERNRNLRPVKWLLAIAGGALLVESSFVWLTPTQVRAAAVVVLVAAAVVTAGVALARITQGPRAVLLVGGRVGVGQFISQWSSSRDIDMRGVCLPEFVEDAAQEIGDVPILGSLDDVVGVAVGLGVDEVVVAPGPLLSACDVRRLSWALESSSVELSVAAEVQGVTPRRIHPRVLGRRLMLSVQPGRRSLPGRWAKEVIDRIAAAMLLVVLLPVLLVIWILIRLDSSGPALFKQTRVGIGGRPFTMYKFRTMVVGAEEMLVELAAENEGAGPMFKIVMDPRTTRLGRLLRSSSVDELPQLINVLKGDMSLIGPRPCLPAETMAYDEWIHRRLRVKPGMTGAWQVGGRSNLSWTDSVRLDIDYVDNGTLREDLWIAMRTARAVMARDGAA